MLYVDSYISQSHSVAKHRGPSELAPEAGVCHRMPKVRIRKWSSPKTAQRPAIKSWASLLFLSFASIDLFILSPPGISTSNASLLLFHDPNNISLHIFFLIAFYGLFALTIIKVSFLVFQFPGGLSDWSKQTKN